jgi:hypothetical protein
MEMVQKSQLGFHGRVVTLFGSLPSRLSGLYHVLRHLADDKQFFPEQWRGKMPRLMFSVSELESTHGKVQAAVAMAAGGAPGAARPSYQQNQPPSGQQYQGQYQQQGQPQQRNSNYQSQQPTGYQSQQPQAFQAQLNTYQQQNYQKPNSYGQQQNQYGSSGSSMPAPGLANSGGGASGYSQYPQQNNSYFSSQGSRNGGGGSSYGPPTAAVGAVGGGFGMPLKNQLTVR